MASTLRGCQGSSGVATPLSPVSCSFCEERSFLERGFSSPGQECPAGDQFSEEDRAVQLARLMFVDDTGQHCLLDWSNAILPTDLLALVVIIICVHLPAAKVFGILSSAWGS